MTTEIDWAKPKRRAAVAPAPRLVGTVTCAVCGLLKDALVCKECAEQPEASRQRVLAWRSANTDQAIKVMDAWDAMREPNQKYWDRIQEMRDQPDFKERCARHRAAQNIYGQLLDAHDRYLQAMQPLDIERARLEKALEALRTL